MRLALVSTISLLVLVLAPVAHAQRGRRAAEPLPIDVVLSSAEGPHRFRVSVAARTDVELTADVRMLHLEVRPAGARRPLTCDAPDRPRRIDPTLVHSLRAGETWSDTFDVRRLCWGRALAALEAGAEVGGTYGLARGRSVPAAHVASGEVRSAPVPVLTAAPVATAAAPTGDVRVSLVPADAASGARVSWRVRVRAVRAVRAWIRPDRFRFRVVRPDGSTRACRMEHGGGGAIPDLFARLGPTRGRDLSLDARAYCPSDTFEQAGVYDVTPILDLDADGTRWRMDTPLGSFEGAPAPVRVRAATSGGGR